MAYIVNENPTGCWNKEHLAKHSGSCHACYCSQVNKGNRWQGSQKCWNANCLTYGGIK